MAGWRGIVRTLIVPALCAGLVACGHLGSGPGTGADTGTWPGAEARISGVSAPELTDVPFFPQQTRRCGPAALATVAYYAGVPVSLEQLNHQVFLPGKKGSLQYDLLGAARRNNLIPYVIDNSPEALLEQLASGRPVVVLQNLALDWLPRWHYAVVIGYLPDDGQFVLRSGRQQRKLTGTRRFLSTWEKSGGWAFVVLPPGEIPSDINKVRYLEAITNLEGAASPDTTVRAFTAAATRWPDDAWVLTGLGNARFAAGDPDGAMTAFRQLLALRPDHIAGRNNLAHLLSLRGCVSAARKEAETALKLAGNDDPLHAVVRQTLAEINQAAEQQGADRDCGTPEPDRAARSTTDQ